METLRLLEKLTQHHGVAGDEKPIADLLEEEISDLGPVRRTPLGSLICTVKQESADKPHVVLEAHMDEIGLMVCGIDEKGFLKVTRCGGIDRRVATASPVLIHGKKGARRGIVGSEQTDPSKTRRWTSSMSMQAWTNSRRRRNFQSEPASPTSAALSTCWRARWQAKRWMTAAAVQR